MANKPGRIEGRLGSHAMAWRRLPWRFGRMLHGHATLTDANLMAIGTSLPKLKWRSRAARPARIAQAACGPAPPPSPAASVSAVTRMAHRSFPGRAPRLMTSGGQGKAGDPTALRLKANAWRSSGRAQSSLRPCYSRCGCDQAGWLMLVMGGARRSPSMRRLGQLTWLHGALTDPLRTAVFQIVARLAR